MTADAVGQVQASLRKRILRAFVGRGLLESFEAQEMLGYKHSGFSADTSVCIAAHDRAGLERLLAEQWGGPLWQHRGDVAGTVRDFAATAAQGGK